MTPTKDDSGAASGDINDEINKAMAEAEAAVEQTRVERATGEFAVMGEDENEGEEEDDDGGDVVEIDAGPSAGPSDAERVEELQAQVASTKDKWLRAVADHDNYRKRVKRDIDDAVMRKTQSLLSSFLPTVDNLERALEIASRGMAEADDAKETDNFGQVIKGIEMVRDEFLGALKKQGIEPVQAVGLTFDPAVHDALQQIDSPDHEPGVIIREFEKGYVMGDRLMRPARVIVAGAGSGSGAS